MRRLQHLGFAVLCGAVLLVPAVAEGGDLVRVDCQNETAYAAGGGIFGDDTLPVDDVHECPFGSGVTFDYRDPLDVDQACMPEDPNPDVSFSNVSGGGRWKTSTVSGFDVPTRALGLNLGSHTPDADCAALGTTLVVGGDDGLGEGPCTCDGGPCHVQARLAADRAFKSGATRQAFQVTVVTRNAEGRWAPRMLIDYVEPLYICTTADPDVRFVQTHDCVSGTTSVAEAELVEVTEGPGQNVVLGGRWTVPAQFRLHRVPVPDGDGGGGCALGQKGDPCSSDADCCSNKCRGPNGQKTCK